MGRTHVARRAPDAGTSRTNYAGRTCRVIADGYIPTGSDPAPETTRHDTACLLNVLDLPAHVVLTVYIRHRQPVGPYRVEVPARRTVEVRFDDLRSPEPIPAGTDFTVLIESDLPVAVQYLRRSTCGHRSALGRRREPGR